MIITICVVWYMASCFINPLFVPSPLAVLDGAIETLKNGQLVKGMLYSFLRITGATTLSVLVAIPLGLITYLSKTVKEIVLPVVNIMRFIPITALYPLLIMWFGIDETMKIAFLFIATFVYMLPSTILCINEVNPDQIDTALTMGMSRLQVTSKVILPASIPSIVQSFIMMYGIGWTYIVMAETINAKYGIGFIINIASARGRTHLVFMSIIVIMIFSVLFDKIGNKLVRKLFAWRFLNDQSA